MSVPMVREAYFSRTEAVAEPPPRRSIIFVDLDGTLIRTDMFVEGLLRLVKKNPLNIFRVLVWMTRGKAYVKSRVAQAAHVDPSRLPYVAPLLDHLRK